MGSWATYGLGTQNRNLPSYVVLNGGRIPSGGLDNFSNGFLPASFQGSLLNAQGTALANISPNEVQGSVQQIKRDLARKLNLELLRLSGPVDALESAIANAELAARMQTVAKDALDISQEDPDIRARYGDGKPYEYQYDGASTNNELILAARRLVEVGVRCVSLTYGRWDSHGNNEGMVRHHGVRIDQAVAALVTDLEERGMLNDVTVLVWGEFGRTPRINKGAGRDHWPQVSCAYIAGGGIQGGQAIGSTNRLGERAQTRPVHVQEIFATVYKNLGIDVRTATVKDPAGRPQYLSHMEPIKEIV